MSEQLTPDDLLRIQQTVERDVHSVQIIDRCDLMKLLNAAERIAELEAELQNIVNAKPHEWGELSGDFEAWAKSRARHALKGGAK